MADKKELVNIVIHGYFGSPDRRMRVAVMKRMEKHLIIRISKWANETLRLQKDGSWCSFEGTGGFRRKHISVEAPVFKQELGNDQSS